MQTTSIDFGAVKMHKALLTNFGTGRGNIKPKTREFVPPTNVYNSVTDTQLKKRARLTRKQYKKIIKHLRPIWEDMRAECKVK